MRQRCRLQNLTMEPHWTWALQYMTMLRYDPMGDCCCLDSQRALAVLLLSVRARLHIHTGCCRCLHPHTAQSVLTTQMGWTSLPPAARSHTGSERAAHDALCSLPLPGSWHSAGCAHAPSLHGLLQVFLDGRQVVFTERNDPMNISIPAYRPLAATPTTAGSEVDI